MILEQDRIREKISLNRTDAQIIDRLCEEAAAAYRSIYRMAAEEGAKKLEAILFEKEGIKIIAKAWYRQEDSCIYLTITWPSEVDNSSPLGYARQTVLRWEVALAEKGEHGEYYDDRTLYILCASSAHIHSAYEIPAEELLTAGRNKEELPQISIEHKALAYFLDIMSWGESSMLGFI